jgi:acyl-CoA synthetase (AMP-forming)/AMP-acid ligase II
VDISFLLEEKYKLIAMISEVATKQPRLLANVIDAKAESIPDEPWLLYANSSNWEQEGGYQTITWKQFANAINKAAFWLDENLPQTEAVQTVSYVGPNDPRYYIIIAAATKSKRRVILSLSLHVRVQVACRTDFAVARFSYRTVGLPLME